MVSKFQKNINDAISSFGGYFLFGSICFIGNTQNAILNLRYQSQSIMIEVTLIPRAYVGFIYTLIFK